MIDASHLFPDLPPLPSFLRKSKSYIKKKYAKVTLQDIQYHVKALILESKKILATDLWAMATLGLRKSELKRVIFTDQDSNFCEVLEVFERKNKNFTTRVIP